MTVSALGEARERYSPKLKAEAPGVGGDIINVCVCPVGLAMPAQTLSCMVFAGEICGMEPFEARDKYNSILKRVHIFFTPGIHVPRQIPATTSTIQ